MNRNDWIYCKEFSKQQIRENETIDTYCSVAKSCTEKLLEVKKECEQDIVENIHDSTLISVRLELIEEINATISNITGNVATALFERKREMFCYKKFFKTEKEKQNAAD